MVKSVTKSVAIIGTRGYPSYYGGFETAVRKLAPYLAERGWEVTVYGRRGSTHPDMTTDTRVQSVITLGVERKSLSTLSYGLTSVLHAIWRRPDVALVMNVANGYWLPLLRARRIPTLVNVDGIEWDRAKWGRTAKAVFRGGARWTARHGTRLVYDAQEIARRWQEDFGRDGAFIPYGGDPSDELALEDGLVHDGYVVFVARFVPENTTAEFFAAVPRIAAIRDVVIIGSSGYGDQFDQQARELADSDPRVRWLGHVSDDRRLHSLWQHASVYFHGHSVGGTNPALVQAMSLGSPVVARDTVYNREVLGDSALFCQPDEQSIVDEITRLALDDHLRRDLSARAAVRAREVYSWDLVCQKYEEELLGLVRA